MRRVGPPRRNPLELEAEIAPIMRKYNITWNVAVKMWMRKVKEKKEWEVL